MTETGINPGGGVLKLIFMGTPDFAAKSLKALIAAGHEIVLAVTQPDKPKGRSKALQSPPVKNLALEAGIPVFQPEKMKTQETLDTLAKCDADGIIVAAYGRILPNTVLKLTKYGCINVHASLLPAYRGAAPIQWAIIDGLKKTGVTIMQMNEGLDTGDIISQAEVDIDEKETSESLFDKLADAGAALLTETLADIEKGNINPTAQPKESTTAYARMLTKEDGKINWETDAQVLERLIRGVPGGAYGFMDGKIVKLLSCDVLNENTEAEPGSIVSADKRVLAVQTGKGQLKINELQLQGKKRMAFDAFLRGCRWVAGMKFDR